MWRSAAADLAPGDLGADVVLRAVGVQRDLRAVEHAQQLRLVGVQAVEQSVEHDEAGAALEDAVEAGAQLGPAAPTGLTAVGLQVGVEPPDELAHVCLGGPLVVGEGVELVDEALGMNPAQGVLGDCRAIGAQIGAGGFGEA